MNDGTQQPTGGRWVLVVAAILAITTFGAYWNSFSVPFLLDDAWAITDNPSIRHLGQIGDVLTPPPLATTTGRPLLNFSFALNYACGGLSVRGYHVVNLLIHIGAGLALLGIVRRTLLLPGLCSRYGKAALPLAACAALLWLLHPMQTECVTYLSQRAESLMGLFYLLTLYGFVRSAGRNSTEDGRGIKEPEPKHRSSLPPVKTPTSCGAGWLVLSVAACFCGMATKQVMVTAPVLVLLYDRAFVSGSFRSALVSRRWYYAGLAVAWLLLGFLMHRSSLSAVGVGFQAGVGWFTYAVTELRVIVDYLKLAIWPHPLVFDYGTEVYVKDLLVVAPYALIIAAILAGVAIAWRRSPMAGFIGCCFFLVLAPASSVVPVAEQPMAESRMYLPLAAVIVGVVIWGFSLVRYRAFIALGIVAIVFNALTVRRNHDYRSEVNIWEDTISRHPNTSRGHRMLADTLAKLPGRLPDVIAHYEEALRLRPDYAEAHNNFANVLVDIPGRLPDAVAHYEETLRIRPNYAEAHNNLATALTGMPGRWGDAIVHYKEALRLRPDYAEAHNNLAAELAKEPSRLPEAIAHYEEALRLQPTYAGMHSNYAEALARTPGRLNDAIAHYEEALRLEPDYVEAHSGLASVLAQMPGRLDEAIAQLEIAARLSPRSTAIRDRLEKLRARREQANAN